MTNTSIPIADGLFVESGATFRLRTALCAICSSQMFPWVPTCPNPSCDAVETIESTAGPNGHIVSYTVLYYAPPPPFSPLDPFVPYAVALVGLAPGLQVVGLIADSDPESLEVGERVHLAPFVLPPDVDGTRHRTWSFVRSDQGGG